jgi:hypothetical protein
MINKEKLKKTLHEMLGASKSKEDFVTSTEILKRKMEKNLIYKDVPLSEFYKIREDVLKESVFDPIHKTRSELIFDKNDKMRPEIKKFIMDILEDWRKNIDIKFNIRELKFIGSMTGFQYNGSADLDINLLTDLETAQVVELRRMLPNGNTIPETTHPVNFWIGGKDDFKDPKNAENIYNMLNDEWEKKTGPKDIKIPYPYIMEVSKFFMDGFDLAISETDRDVLELSLFMEYDPNKQELTEKEKREAVANKVNELKADIDRLKVGKHILRSFMVEGYEDMPFKVSISYQHEDPRYSMNSMVYKMIDRLGYYNDKLPNAIKKAQESIKKAESYLATEVEE